MTFTTSNIYTACLFFVGGYLLKMSEGYRNQCDLVTFIPLLISVAIFSFVIGLMTVSHKE